jgi:hypothetical protein
LEDPRGRDDPGQDASVPVAIAPGMTSNSAAPRARRTRARVIALSRSMRMAEHEAIQ